MGVTIEIDNLEQMCDLMCDNKIPKKRSDRERAGKVKLGGENGKKQ